MRQAVGQELEGDRSLHVAADDHLRVLEELLHEGQEREHQEPENERARRLTEDVAVEESVHRGFSRHSDSSARVAGFLERVYIMDIIRLQPCANGPRAATTHAGLLAPSPTVPSRPGPGEARPEALRERG